MSSERVRVASRPKVGHGTFAAAGGGFCGVVVSVNSAVDEPRTSFACCRRWTTNAGDDADGEQEEHYKGDEEAPHGGVRVTALLRRAR